MTPIKLSLSILIATLTACSTITEPMPPPDITEERLRLRIGDDCFLSKESLGIWLKCGKEPQFIVGDDCVIEQDKDGKVLDCGE